MSDRLKTLYGQLVRNGYDLGGYEKFNAAMHDSNRRRSLYNQLVANRADLGGYEKFSSVVENTPPTTPSAPQKKRDVVADTINMLRTPSSQYTRPQPSKSVGTFEMPSKYDVYHDMPDAVKRYQTPTPLKPEAVMPSVPSSAAESVWAAADKAAGAEVRKKVDEGWSWRKIMQALSSGASVTGGLGDDNAQALETTSVAHLKTHDLQKLSDQAWAALGSKQQQSIINDSYIYLKEQYPDADDKALVDAARKMARAKSDEQMYNLAVEKNMPKSVGEFFLRKAAAASSFGSLSKGYASMMAGTRGDMEAEDTALQKYGAKHKVADIAGSVAGFAIDPLTYASGAVGGASTKVALWAGGKVLSEAAARKMSQTLGGKLLLGAVGGAANFGTFEAGGEALNQYKWGGTLDVDPETGRYVVGDFSLGKVASQMRHGLTMGGLTGAFGTWLGNVSTKAAQATSSTLGKLGVRTGELGVGLVGEGTIFATPEFISTYGDYNDVIKSVSDKNSPNYIADDKERSKYIAELKAQRGERMMDIWQDNLAMIAGFKAQHAIKSAGRTISELAASRKGKVGFVERMGRMLDGHPSLALSKEEQTELDNHGYGGLTQMVKEYKAYAQKDGDLPYNKITQLLNDKNVSEAARAKMYYYVTGHSLPMSAVIASNVIDNGDKTYTVQSLGDNGVITSRTYGSRKRADYEKARIDRQAELNGVAMAEQMFDNMDKAERLKAVCTRLAQDKGVSPETLLWLTRKDPKQMTAAEKRWVKEIEDAANEDAPQGENATVRHIKGVILDEYGVDVDKALRKAADSRTDAEKTAISAYNNELAQAVAERKNAISQGETTDAYRRGYEADTQGMRDAYVAQMYEPSEDNAETLRGVESQITESAKYQAALERDELTQMTHKDGSIHLATLKEKDKDGNGKQVYIVDGDIVMKEDGSGIDADASSKSVIIYDPATGEKKMVSPTAVDGIESLGEVKTAEQTEAEINARMQDTIQRGKDWLEGNVANPVGMQIQLGDGRIATIEAMHEDGKSAIATLPDGTQFLVPKDVLQRIVNNGQYADYKARRDAEASKREAEQDIESAPETATEGGQPLPEEASPKEEESREYAQGDVFDVVVDGQKMHAEIVSPKDADGRFVVNVDDGESMRTLYVTPEELAAMEYREEPSAKAEETRLATEGSSEKALERGEQPTEEHTPTALERIPRDEKGNAQFHDVDTETAWDGLVEMSGNEETAHKVAEASLANAERKLKAAKALKEKGETPEELLRSIKENEAAAAEAQRVVDAWKAIVGEESRREEAAKAEAERIATEKAEAERKAAEERERAEAEEKTRIEAEKKEAERIAAEKAEEEARVEAERKAEEERIAKQKAEEKTAEAESDKEEAEKRMNDEEPKPVGSGVFGNIYNQFKGKVKEAFDFLMKHKGGDLLGVFHRKDVGDIDLVWGDHGGGLAHIIRRHIIEQNDFKNVDEIQKVIEDVIRNGLIVRENKDKINIEYNGYRVSIKKTIRDSKGNVVENKNWIVTAFDKSKPKHEKRNPSSSETLTTPSANQKADGVTLPSNEDSIDKGSKKAEKKQKKQSVFDKAKEITDKEEKKRKAEAEDDSVLGQATRAVGKKKKVNLFKYTVSKKISISVLRGVHYANGYAYASDGYILFKEKADYPKEWEGTTRDKDGNLIDGKYPDTEKAIHRLVHIPDNEVESLPSKEVLDFAIAASKKLKGEAISVAIDGIFFNAVNLKKFFEAVASKGMDKIVYRHPMLYATNGKDEIVMMPTVNTLEGALDIADKMESAGLPKEQIDAWKAHIEAADKKMSFEDFKKAVENAKKEGDKAERPKQKELTEAERELRDNLVERMRKGGLDVVTDSEEMQRVIDTENERTRMMGAKQKRALETATIAAEATNNATVISSADGAKIQNNLGTLATNYEKIANKTRGFITDLSHALGLKQHESSQYGTFETPDGKWITIRVSNHNARVSNFDKNNESDGISIVISSHKNKGLLNDGNAHIIEYFYPKRALENAEGKPLAEMIRSVSDALAGEEFKDTTGLAEREEVNAGSVREHRVYHGSGADFDAFDHSHMGEGEGAQAYGWGTYVTEVEGIGRTYAIQNSKYAREYPVYNGDSHGLSEGRINEILEVFLDGVSDETYILRAWDDAMQWYSNKKNDDYAQSLVRDASLLNPSDISIAGSKTRNLYTVEIPDDNGDNYLDWNGHPAESLLKDVGSFLESNGFERVQDSPVRYEKGESTVVLNPNATGADLYAELREALGSDKKASQALAELGCIGIKYPADNMRGGRKDGAKNYVIFNENDAKITDHTRFLRTADGEVYGLVKDGRIYLDPKVATAETAVHEYTHLWGDMLRRKDSEQWNHTVKELKNSVLWEEVKESYPELQTDDEIADEVLSTFSGRRGAERLREEARRVADGDGGVFTKAKAIETLERVKEAIARFWEGVARMFGINRYRSAEELADMAMKDLLDSKNPMKDESGMRKRGEVGETLATSGTYFSGGGLLEAGLKGVIDPKVAVEFSEKIAGVYADNHGNHIVVADVRDVDPKKLVGAVDGGEVQYFHASPVCKNFSKAKREGGEVELDKETALSTAEFIAKTRPKVVTIENVKGYRNSEALKIITDELTRQGYDWDADVYNTADYGGYTKRERLIVRAKRNGKLPPKPEKLPEELRKKGWYSAVEDLIPHLEEKKTGVPQGTDERLKNSGIDYRTIDKPLYVFGRGYANKTVGHAFADELLPTLTTGGGDIIIMPDGRVLKASPRVLARVTGLPDTYKMPETDQLSHTIVGNGIPTQLTEGVIAPLLDNAIPSAERATKRESVFDVADRVSQNLEERTRAMGSRVEKRMADVAQKLEGKELSMEQKAVVDVFSGKSDNQKFSVEREDGKKQTYLLKQGNEEKAGAKHSLYRHYGTNTGVITADDVLKIPQVLERGERIEKAKGGKKMAVYTMDVDGAKFTVYTRIGKDYETIDDFYSNKKGSERYVLRNTDGVNNTPEGAHNPDSEPSAKVEDKSESPKLFGEEIIDDGKKGSDSTDRSVRENPKNEDKPRLSRKPGESIFDYASRVSDSVDRSVRERVSARDEYEKKVKSKGFQTKEALQNSMLGLQEFMFAIDHASGNKRYIEDIPDFENPILGENRLSSVNKEEMHQVAKTQFKPLMSAVAKLSGNGKESGELYDYMFAKHGLERDAVMRQREAQKEFDKYQKAHPKGTKTIGDFVASLEGKDYAGLTALTAEDGRVKSIQSQIDAIDEQMKATDDQLLLRNLGGQKKRLKVDLLKAARDAADDIRKTFESDPSHDRSDINELWSRVNEVNGNTLRKLYESGMLTKEAYNDISSMYTNYIPMRGFDQTTSADAYAYLTHGDSAFNAPIKTAKGRSSKADNPIAYMQAMAESAIMQGNRNVLVKQKMLNFVRNHPSDLASVSDVWLQYDSVADEWKPVFPDNIGANDSASVVAKKMGAFEDKMKQMAEKHPDLVQRSNEAPDIPYKVVEKGQLNEHQVLVKQNGKSYIITVNGSPRAAQAANGLTNPDTDFTGAVGKVLEGAEALNRQLSSLYTTLNPDFIGSNYVRDALYSNTMVYVKEGAKYGGSFNLNFAKYNPAEMANLYARYNKGILDTSNETHRLFLEFMQNGGETGFVNLKQIEKRKSEIAKAIKRDGEISAAQIWGGLSDAVDFANRAVENSARFAAYVTSRKSGRSVGRSVYDAKEISVNFNRKGSGSKFMGAEGQTKAGNAAAFVSGAGRGLYIFWNAGIQGLANFSRQIGRHPGRALTLAALLFGFGALMSYLGNGDDDDENNYFNLPKYIRRSNVCYKIGDLFVTIPLPVEYRSFYGLGELAISTLAGKEDGTTKDIAKEALSQVSQLFPIDFAEGGGGLHALIPSAVKPIVEAETNTAWTGLPIYKDNDFNKNMPEYTKVYKTANGYLVEIARALNDATGGNKYKKGFIDINPAKMEYVLKGMLGGAFSFPDKLVKTTETIMGDREFDWRNTPFANRFVKNADERTEYKSLNEQYFKLKDEMDVVKQQLKGFEKEADAGNEKYEKALLQLEDSKDYERLELFKDYEKEFKGLNDELKELRMSPDYDKAEEKELQKEIAELQRQLIGEMREIKK